MTAWVIWELFTEEYTKSDVTSLLLVLGFSALAFCAGIAFSRRIELGHTLIRVVSTLALLYSAAWLLLGGVDDAPGYSPAMIFMTLLAIYSFVTSRLSRS